MTLVHFFTPALVVSIAFMLFVAIFGKKFFMTMRQKAQEHQEFVKQPFHEIQMLLQEAQDVLDKEKAKKEERKNQEKNIEMLSKLEIKSIKEELEKIIVEEKKTAETLYQQHVHSIILQWKKERMQELFQNFRTDVCKKIDGTPNASSDFGKKLLKNFEN